MKVSKVSNYAALAAKEAISRADCRTFLLGAIGVRSDGALVKSRNLPTMGREIAAHAEARLVKKLDYGSIVIVVRVKKADGTLGCSKPCPSCEALMSARGVKCVYYVNHDGSIKKMKLHRRRRHKRNISFETSPAN